MVSGGVKEEVMKGGGKCDGNADKENGIVFLVRMVFCCVRPLEGCGGLGGLEFEQVLAHRVTAVRV